MTVFPAPGIRALVAVGTLAIIGCASSQVDGARIRLLPTRKPAQSVTHPPQNPRSAPIPGLLQASNRSADGKLVAGSRTI